MPTRSLMFISFTVLAISSCTSDGDNSKVFTLVPPSESSVFFSNDLVYTEDFNAYTYRNFYNGGGVALGDINNDGLLDIYFSGNQVDNKLYFNKGNFVFEDITERAGVACPSVWSTGVSMADVNGDGWLDIFVCKSGPPLGGVRHNELFINNGDLTFTESSRAWGVNDEGLSIHAVFFDYDKDGDLDFYLLNNSNRSVGIYDLKIGQREIRDVYGGNKLYKNVGDRFEDVSESAGIYGSAIGFGLGVTASDINKDGWVDIYVSNDFFERDYLYINNTDGTFEESLDKMLNEISMGSMGADIADIDNDCYPEIYVTEMLPHDLDRARTKTVFESWDKYSANVTNGYHHQFSRNTLQKNNGLICDTLKTMSFSEIGRFSGVHATDWSWGALIFDYNNDGLKDMFVSNGIAKDLTDQDYITFDTHNIIARSKTNGKTSFLKELIDKIPSAPVQNYLFENRTMMQFENIASQSGLDLFGFSNGAAYGDLNNDGLMDLVINNVNSPASLYRNTDARGQVNNYIQIKLQGHGKNTYALGTQVTAFCGNDKYYVEQYSIKGYLSSVDPKLHIGIGNHTSIDSIEILWPSGGTSILKEISVNRLLTIDESKTSTLYIESRNGRSAKKLFTRVDSMFNDFKHLGNAFVDFNRDKLLFEMISNEGPKLSVGDVNNDSLQDLFVSGGQGQIGHLWVQRANSRFESIAFPAYSEEIKSENIEATFFDANSDGFEDLYIGSGGNQFSYGAPELKDRLYLNNGKGNFIKSLSVVIPAEVAEPTSFVLSFDYDKDGYVDLVTGSRSVPFYYGVPASARIFRNKKDQKFEDVTNTVAPGLLKLGLLTDAISLDYDNDKDSDIVICGEWMGVKVFRNDNGFFVDVSSNLDIGEVTGFWTTLKAGDFNNDGYLDLAVGNLGLNYLYKASDSNPYWMYVGDFDRSGSIEQLVCQTMNNKVYTIAQLPDLWKQIPITKKRIQTYNSYRDATLNDMFSFEELKNAIKLNITEMRSVIFLNDRGRSFKRIALPQEAQYSKMYAVCPIDFDFDGNLDLLLGGNQTRSKPELGIQNASYGVALKGNGDGTFRFIKYRDSGFFVKGEIRDIQIIRVNGWPYVVVSRHNETTETFKINKQ